MTGSDKIISYSNNSTYSENKYTNEREKLMINVMWDFDKNF